MMEDTEVTKEFGSKVWRLISSVLQYKKDGFQRSDRSLFVLNG